jgi:ubiquinone/menaquinone biosynthesis C-methylase UbiE
MLKFLCHLTLGGVMKKSEIAEIEKLWKRRFFTYDKIFDFNKNIGKRHLDFGCGIGTFAKMLAEKYSESFIMGMDIDEQKIEIAKKIYTKFNLKFKCLRKAEEKFDSITVILVLHEIGDLGAVEGVLKNLYDSLKAEGRIMIYEFRKRSRDKYIEWYKRGKQKEDFEKEYKKHNRWTVKEFKEICEKVGFKTIKLKAIGDFWLAYIGEKSPVTIKSVLS